ncbi:sucrose phosphate phosphatase [Pyrus ussuriensis x Pyrus communis]|uniref:Sucrose phosphate phosphatase n=1 Tax=Pyrus ussuriensis x Pyrus communis TaxID=2448454 RepID=A0A5N5HXE6_9ROSA|nr:sucrose phosphate phosphatase [Pyrus ussuriensis x Pyrus communis]
MSITGMYIVYGKSSVSNDPSISSPPPPPPPDRVRLQHEDECEKMQDELDLQKSKSPSGTFVHLSGVEHYLSDSINALRNCYGDKQLFTPF